MSNLLFIFLLFLSSCVSMSQDEKEAPPITKETTIEQAIDIAIVHGGESLKLTKEKISNESAWKQAHSVLLKRLRGSFDDEDPRQLLLTLNLYQASIRSLDFDLVKRLLRSESTIAVQAGWQLLAYFPSPQAKSFIDAELSEAIAVGVEAHHLVPQMAEAVRMNQAMSAYSVVKRGLMETGHESFAEAMSDLNPGQASTDFLDYLSLAPIEELRQLTQKSVNLYACLVALKHLARYPVQVGTRNFEQIFYYAVSRNNGLADLARIIIEHAYAGEHADMAIVLARLPSWVQIAFVEGSRRQRSPKLNLLLAELKRFTPQDDVIAEIDEALR